MNLRPEFRKLLPHAGLHDDSLITLDDLPQGEVEWRKLTDGTNFRSTWTLVDHNQLQGVLGKLFSSNVVAVIDHHAIEGEGDQRATAKDNIHEHPYVITPSGSCSSLVTEYVRSRWDRLSKANSNQPTESAEQELQWHAEVAKLALASILIDTSNLGDAYKVTEHDTQAVDYLESKLKEFPKLAPTFDRTVLFDEISTAKLDVGQLTITEILRKDYKQWEEGNLKVGISSVVKPIEWLAQHADHDNGVDGRPQPLLDAIERFTSARELDLFVLMTAFANDSKFERQLLLLPLSVPGRHAASVFETNASGELGLQTISPDMHLWSASARADNHFMKIWQQTKTQHSRKRVAPLIRELMRGSGQKL